MVSDPRGDQFAFNSSVPSSASRQNCKHVLFKQTNYSQGNRTADRPKEAIAHSSTRQVKSAGSLVTVGDDDDDDDGDGDGDGDDDDDDDDDGDNDDDDDDDDDGDEDGDGDGDDDDDDDDDDQTSVTIPAEVAKYTTEYLTQILPQGQQTVHDNNRKDPLVTLELWDFAGQHLYYASHPVFFSPRGVYLLVHNLSKRLDAPAEPCVRQGTHDIFLENPNGETNMENLLSWLVTVHGSRPIDGECVGNTEKEDLAYLRPPVIIVGTHADMPVEDINVITSQIQRGISGKEYEKHVIRPFFNVDNTKGKGKGKESMLRRMMRRYFGQRLAGIVFVSTAIRVTMR